MIEIQQLIPVLSFAAIDFIIPVRAMFTKKKTMTTVLESDFTILVPIYGNISYLKNLEFLKKYPKNVILCTTSTQSEEFKSQLKSTGLRVFEANLHGKPNPWAIFQQALSTVESRFTVLLDADTVPVGNLEEMVGHFAHENADLASVRILPRNSKSLIEKLQEVEYKIAMDARGIYPWLTSGACMVGKTISMRAIYNRHSLFFQGGDIETGKLAEMLGMNVTHLPHVMLTDVPSTWRKWFKQRSFWMSGAFRHSVINIFTFSWTRPFFWFYTTWILFLLAPFRLYEAVSYPGAILLVVMAYWLLSRIFIRNISFVTLLIFPFYGMIQAFVLVPVGVWRYFQTVKITKNWGIIRCA